MENAETLESVQFDHQQWANEQFADASLGDKRRSNRLAKLAAQIATRPGASIPQIA